MSKEMLFLCDVYDAGYPRTNYHTGVQVRFFMVLTPKADLHKINPTG